MHVEEPLTVDFCGLFQLQLGEEVDEPQEGALIAVDPEEVHFGQIEHGLAHLVA